MKRNGRTKIITFHLYQMSRCRQQAAIVGKVTEDNQINDTPGKWIQPHLVSKRNKFESYYLDGALGLAANSQEDDRIAPLVFVYSATLHYEQFCSSNSTEVHVKEILIEGISVDLKSPKNK